MSAPISDEICTETYTISEPSLEPISEYAYEECTSAESLTSCLSYGTGTDVDSLSEEEQDLESIYNLGSMYFDGKYVPQSYEKAAEWFDRAAKYGYAKAQCQLGVMYAQGLGVKKSKNLAIFWIVKAAEQNDPDAMHNLDLMFRLAV